MCSRELKRLSLFLFKEHHSSLVCKRISIMMCEVNVDWCLIENDMGTDAWPHDHPTQYILVPIPNSFPHHLLHAVPMPAWYCVCCPHPHPITAGLCGLEHEAEIWSHFINTMTEHWGCGLWNVKLAWLRCFSHSRQGRQHHYTVQWSWATECPKWLSDWPQSDAANRAAIMRSSPCFELHFTTTVVSLVALLLLLLLLKM